MNLKFKWLVALFSIISLCGAVYFIYGYLYKDARNIAAEVPSHTITSTRLIADYTHDARKADNLYINKVLEVKGRVTQVMDSVLVLDSVIVCAFNEPTNAGVLNSNIILKGRCIGYDELFGEVRLDQCIKQ